MDGAALLSMSDVQLIRRYVQTKYAPLPQGRRAEIVADAVRRAIERRLPSFPQEMRERLAGDLIRRCVLAERRDVRPDDVLDVCAERAWELPLIREPLLAWIEEQAPGRWTPEQVLSRLRRGDREAGTAAEPRPALALVPPSGPPAVHAAAEQAPAEPEAGAAVRRRLRPGLPLQAARPLRRHLLWAALAAALAAGGTFGAGLIPLGAREAVPAPAPSAAAALEREAEQAAGMPPELRYAAIDAAAVRAYLRGRDSLLAEEPYFSAIIASARKHDVHPLLLFAIAGQEQGFVPRTGARAKQIANNPFNVFHSWTEYNTDIYDSSDIAARTIAKLGRQRPKGYDPFAWFNTRYAEDPHWAEGVRQIFNKLSSLPAAESR